MGIFTDGREEDENNSVPSEDRLFWQKKDEILFELKNLYDEGKIERAQILDHFRREDRIQKLIDAKVEYRRPFEILADKNKLPRELTDEILEERKRRMGIIDDN